MANPRAPYQICPTKESHPDSSIPQCPSTPPKRKMLGRDQRLQIMHYRIIGHSYRLIQQETGFSMGQIRWTIKSGNATPRKRGHPPCKLSEEDVNKIIEFIRANPATQGMSWPELKAKLQVNVSTTTLQKTLEKRGFYRDQLPWAVYISSPHRRRVQSSE